jgi:hypothetical protein
MQINFALQSNLKKAGCQWSITLGGIKVLYSLEAPDCAGGFLVLAEESEPRKVWGQISHKVFSINLLPIGHFCLGGFQVQTVASAIP